MNIAVLGLGKVGLPMASYFSALGHAVLGFDTNEGLTRRLIAGEEPLPWEPFVKPVAVVTELAKALDQADVVYIIVPTPLIENRLSIDAVQKATRQVQAQWRGPIIIGSTIEPADASGLCSDSNIGYSPPLIRLGHVVEDLTKAAVVLSGAWNAETHAAIRQLWKRETLCADPVTIAMAKLAINVSLSLRVAWANELAEVCQSAGADASIVLEAIQRDPRIGRGYMIPGWSPSGPCLPRDLEVWTSAFRAPIAQTMEARHLRTRSQVIASVHTKLLELKVKRVGILGLVYNVGALDTTFSQGTRLATSIRDMAYEVRVYDPAQYYLPDLGLDHAVSMADLESWAEVLIIATPWPEFEALKTEKPIIDLRR